MRSAFLLLYLLCIGKLLHSQQIQNPGFEQFCFASSTGLCNWDLSWGGPNTCKSSNMGGIQHMYIYNDADGAVGFAEQTVKLNPGEGVRVIDLSAKIASINVMEKGAGLNLTVYDTAGNVLATKDMGYGAFGWIQGTNGWKDYTIRTVCPAEASYIKVGAILYGKGKAMFDDFSLSVTPVKGRKPSALATEYISMACDSIAFHSLWKDSVDIKSLKSQALEIAGTAETYADCHLAVSYLLSALGDHHSFFMSPEEVKDWETDSSAAAGIEYPSCRVTESCGYIYVPPFHGGNMSLMTAYADTLQAALDKLSRSGINGWIIDLRGNTGGNMAPMIAGLGPVFDAEKLGYLVDVRGEKDAWMYVKGTYGWESEEVMKVLHPVTLSEQLPIAVLIGPSTGSSGEIVALSFIGNGQTRIFGEPTWGLTTGNGSFDLPDGGRMMLASTIMADRTGKLYGGKIYPDEQIDNGSYENGDLQFQRAIEWVNSERR